MATTRSKKTNSTTASPIATGMENNGVAFSGQQNSTLNGATIAAFTELYSDSKAQVDSLNDRIKKLEEMCSRQDRLCDEAAKTSKTSRILMILLMFIPFVQLFGCWLIIVYFGKQDQLPNLLFKFLDGISIMSALEAVILPIKMFFDHKKNKELEDDIKQIQEEMKE